MGEHLRSNHEVRMEIVSSEIDIFRRQHSEVPSFLKFDAYAARLQQRIGDALAIDPEKLRKLSLANIAELQLGLFNNESTVVLVRHGLQATTGCDELSAAEKKIAQMKAYRNMYDPMDITSFPEAAAMGYILSSTAKASGKEIRLYTSKNARAKQAADVLGKTLGTRPTESSIFNCINYQDNEDLLSLIPDGTVPWERDIINTVCGNGTYDRVSRSVQTFLNQRLRDAQPGVDIVVTHTQQLMAAAEMFKLPDGRLGNFGCVLIGNKTQELIKTGIFTS